MHGRVLSLPRNTAVVRDKNRRCAIVRQKHFVVSDRFEVPSRFDIEICVADGRSLLSLTTAHGQFLSPSTAVFVADDKITCMR